VRKDVPVCRVAQEHKAVAACKGVLVRKVV
jgi:hypothetical protein